jgi:hypothetical protein
MSMVEKVARAIYKDESFYGEDPKKVAWVEGGNSFRQDDARQLAYAALLAMREPSEAMIAAATPELMKFCRVSNGFCSGWQKAIDAALAEGDAP